MRRKSRPAKSAAPPTVEICHEFRFDAAHRFQGMPRGHRYRGLHGHSFRAEVAVRGTPRPPHGFVADFAKIQNACRVLSKRLDHSLLNDVAGLENPSLEYVCVWIWDRLARKFPGLARVTVYRDSLGQSCSYSGPETSEQRPVTGLP